MKRRTETIWGVIINKHIYLLTRAVILTMHNTCVHKNVLHDVNSTDVLVTQYDVIHR